MIWMDVDVALSEVPVNILPLIDDTDFKTREESVVYNQAGMDLVWNFVTPAGAFTQTAVTPTTAGVHDWTNQGNGMYTIEIPAAAGTINNNLEGFGWFTGFATGILPWRGPVIGFRAAGLNGLLVEDAFSATRGLAGTALPNAAADAAGGLPISDAGGLDLDAMNTNINDIETDTNELQTDDVPGLIAALNDPTAAAIADAVWDELQSAHVTVGSFGEVATEVASILADTNELQTDDVPGLIAALNDPTAAAVAIAVWDALQSAHVTAGSFGEIATEIAAILADTNELQTDDVPGLIAALNDPTAATIAAAVWDALQASHVTAGSFGEIATEIASILADTNELQTDDVPGLIAALNDPTAAAVAVAVWDALQASHVTGGSFGEIATEIAAILTDTSTTLQAELDGIQADTEDIQARLPAALVSGKMDADMTAISGDATAADRLEAMMDGLLVCQVNDVAATTTAFAADGFTEASDDHYNGRLITFLTGALAGQQTDITDYDAAGHAQGAQTLVVTALTEAPANDDFFIIH